MINLPPHIQPEFDALTDAQKNAFMKLVMMGAAGSPGNLIISHASFENALKSVKLMGETPDTPIEPDKTVNHDWNFKFK
jgi:hypothetical protein